MNKQLILFILLSILISSCENQESKLARIKYIESVEAWHAQRIDRLKERDSWLSLAGLFWLQKGINTIGCDSSNDIVFPPGGAAKIGSLVLTGSEIRFVSSPDAEVYHNDSLITIINMKSDQAGQPNILKSGRYIWYVIKRGERLALRLKDTQHKNFSHFTDIPRFPVNPAWRVSARLEPYDPPKKIAIPNILGMVERSQCPGALVFELNGKTYRLDPIIEGPDEPLFIIFSDLTSGKETYGAGRFLYADRPDSTGHTILDFNKAYNPPCVFTNFATCPLPPRQNWLETAITAGEKDFHLHSD